MKNAQLQRVWQSMKDVPMLFVTLAVLLVLVILSEKGFEDARVWVVAGLVLVTVIDTLIGMIALKKATSVWTCWLWWRLFPRWPWASFGHPGPLCS